MPPYNCFWFVKKEKEGKSSVHVYYKLVKCQVRFLKIFKMLVESSIFVFKMLLLASKISICYNTYSSSLFLSFCLFGFFVGFFCFRYFFGLWFCLFCLFNLLIYEIRSYTNLSLFIFKSPNTCIHTNPPSTSEWMKVERGLCHQP